MWLKIMRFFTVIHWKWLSTHCFMQENWSVVMLNVTLKMSPMMFTACLSLVVLIVLCDPKKITFFLKATEKNMIEQEQKCLFLLNIINECPVNSILVQTSYSLFSFDAEIQSLGKKKKTVQYIMFTIVIQNSMQNTVVF